MNFWDLVYPEEAEHKIEYPACFDKYELLRLADAFKLFLNKKAQDVLSFIERVDLSLAADYRQYIPCEMWLQLVLQRIENNYYRSQD